MKRKLTVCTLQRDLCAMSIDMLASDVSGAKSSTAVPRFTHNHVDGLRSEVIQPIVGDSAWVDMFQSRARGMRTAKSATTSKARDAHMHVRPYIHGPIEKKTRKREKKK